MMNVALDKELHRRLAISGLDTNTAMAELIRQAVRDWLDRRKKKVKGRK